MEFWGVEVKAGEPLKLTPKFENIIHISQAALGESKKDKGNESVILWVKFGDQKFVLGTLSPENIPQLSFDLVFEKEFELSHNWKNGSVHICGYQSPLPEEDLLVATYFSDEDEDEEEEEEKVPSLVKVANGNVENTKPATTTANASKPESSAKPKAKLIEPSKDNKPEDDSDEDDESDEEESDEDDEEDDESDDGMFVDEDSDDDKDDDDESEDEETPGKAKPEKKRPNDSATKTPVPSKKFKSATPQKTDVKKGGHSATPHPAKQTGKTNANNSKQQTPKSGGQFSCKSCDRSFGSEVALQSHSKAKHGGK